MTIPTPISFWNFDETSGDAADALGVNQLTNSGGASYVTGKINNASDYDAGEYMGITDASQTGLDFSTVMSGSAWVNITAHSINVSTVFGKYGAASQSSYWFAIESSAGAGGDTLYFFMSTNGTNEFNCSATGLTFDTGTWYHVAVTYNGGASAGSRCKLYVNGSSVTVTDNTSTTIHNGNRPFNTGSITPGVGNRQLDGVLDMLGVWNVELSAAEVAELYNGGTGVQYPFPSSAIKTIDGLAKASVKTVDGLAIASVKNINGLA